MTEARIVCQFRDMRTGFDFAGGLVPTNLMAALTLCGEESPEDRFTSTTIIETFMPPTGHKLRSRMSTFNAKQWPKVVERTVAGAEATEDIWFPHVGLVPGQPFDNTDAAASLPDNFPKSSLKGVAAGPVRVTISPSRDETSVTVTLPMRGETIIDDTTLWLLAADMLRAVADDPAFEIAAVRTADASGDEFSTDEVDRPVVLISGPALQTTRRERLRAEATEVLEHGGVHGLKFDRR